MAEERPEPFTFARATVVVIAADLARPAPLSAAACRCCLPDGLTAFLVKHIAGGHSALYSNYYLNTIHAMQRLATDPPGVLTCHMLAQKTVAADSVLV